jgi:hypothetical protein
MSFFISISGIDHEVSYNFFTSLDIVSEDLIGNTYFIKCKEESGTFFCFSISKIPYEKLKLDKKIDDILK